MIRYGTLLQNAADIITKCDSYFITKCDKSLLQNATFIKIATVHPEIGNITLNFLDFSFFIYICLYINSLLLIKEIELVN